MKILFIVGSFRKHSLNRQLAEKAAELIGDRAEISFLNYENVPLMNPDFEYPPPEEVVEARKKIQEADGIWIVSAEYNHSYPGILKNLLDWASRPYIKGDPDKVTCVKGKKCIVSGVAGKSAAADMAANLSELFKRIKMEELPDSFRGVSLVGGALHQQELTLTDENISALREQADRFIEYIS